MEALGIHTGLDLRQWSKRALVARFGKAGAHYHALARAEDDRPVVAERRAKSIGAELTFARDLTRGEEVGPALAPVLAKAWAAYARSGLTGRIVTVKAKYADFRQVTRARTTTEAIASRSVLERASLDLLWPLFPAPLGVRLLGVTLSGFESATDPGQGQLTLALA